MSSLSNRPPILYPKNFAAKPHLREEHCRSQGCSALYEAGGDDGLARVVDVVKSLEPREIARRSCSS